MKMVTLAALAAMGACVAVSTAACVDEETVYVHRDDDDGGSGGSGGGVSAGGTANTGGQGTGGMAEGGSGGQPLTCTAGTEANCIACGGDVCDATAATCCSDGTTASCSADCMQDWSAACDGAEDCPGQQCCVVMSLFQNDPDGATATCGVCDISGGSSSARSVACRTQSDCAGVRNNFNVPYSECCFAPEYEVGICVSQTSAFVDFNDNCNL